MKTNLYYTADNLRKKTLVVLDAIAEELGIVYEDEFKVANPKKALVVEAILKKQDALRLEEEGATNTKPPMHRELDEAEEREFRAWAHRHYQPQTPIDPTWHPVILEECAEINAKTDIVAVVAKKGAKPKATDKVQVAAPVKQFVPKTVVELVEAEQFCFEGQRKVYQTIKVYTDDKNRKHVVVKTDAPTKSQPAEMDLYYKNHLQMNVLVLQN